MTFIYHQKKTSVTHRDRQSMKVMKASALPEDIHGESHIVGGRDGQGMWRFGKLGGRTVIYLKLMVQKPWLTKPPEIYKYKPCK